MGACASVPKGQREGDAPLPEQPKEEEAKGVEAVERTTTDKEMVKMTAEEGENKEGKKEENDKIVEEKIVQENTVRVPKLQDEGPKEVVEDQKSPETAAANENETAEKNTIISAEVVKDDQKKSAGNVTYADAVKDGKKAVVADEEKAAKI